MNLPRYLQPGDVRYFEGRGLVHVQIYRGTPNQGWWEWPQGHVDAALRVTKACEEKPITCFFCLRLVR